MSGSTGKPRTMALSAHEAIVAVLNAQIDRLDAQLRLAIERGFDRPTTLTTQPAPFVYTGPQKPEPSYLATVIRQEAAGDPRLAEYLHKRKRELKKEHPKWTDAEIGEELQRWDSSEPAEEA